MADELTNNSNQTGSLSASEEMIRLLGLDKPAVEPAIDAGDLSSHQETSTLSSVTLEPVSGLAVKEAPKTTVITEPLPFTEESLEHDYVAPAPKAWLSSALSSAVSILPYLLIFIIGVVVYYAFFADPSNRPTLFSPEKEAALSPLTAKAEALETLKTELGADFRTWLSQYYFDISDESLLEADRVAVNKLTNFENYLLNINPRTNDIRKTGRVDASYILEGVDPNTGLPLKDSQKDIIAQYFDLSAIQERILDTSTTLPLNSNTPASGIMPRGPQVVGYVVPTVHLFGDAGEVSSPAVQQAPTPAVASSSSQPTKIAPLTGPSGCEENSLGIDTKTPGRIEIPSIGVNVPIVWTKTPSDFNKDLEVGVVHYPCTPLPGDVGKSYISGHSSNYTWAGGNYNKVFSRMNELKEGMTFKITVVGKDGKDIKLFYVIQSKQEYAADDQAQFLNTAYSEVALSTCWPINTTKRRLVTTARLDRVER